MQYPQQTCRVCGFEAPTVTQVINHMLDCDDEAHRAQHARAKRFLEDHPDYARKYPRANQTNQVQQQDKSTELLTAIHTDLQQIIKMLSEILNTEKSA